MIAHADTYRFSVEEFHQLGNAGILDEDDRVELLNGEIIIMAPMGKRHHAAIRFIDRFLQRRFGDVAFVDCQLPLILEDFSEPQPDVLLIDPKIGRAGEPARPDDVFLVIEVSDSTLRYDSRTKLAAYAKAGIREYWIVNLADNTLEVFRQPRGETYAETQRFSRGDKVAPVAFPDRPVEVGEFIP